MNNFNRDYAIVSASGRVLAETNSKVRADRWASEYRAGGHLCEVVKSSRPMYDHIPETSK